jgi:hypothetical protein
MLTMGANLMFTNPRSTFTNSVRMNWVVVTDTNGNRLPQMNWRAIQ